MAPPLQGLRGASGLRTAWERQQQAAQLAASAGRIPHQARSKPAFLAAQLQPVMAALRQAAQEQQEKREASRQGEETAQGGAGVQELEQQQEEQEQGQRYGTSAAQQLKTAVAQLRRLVGVDCQAGANAALLLWLLLGMVAGEGELEGKLLVQLCAAMGWEMLLLEALTLLLLQQQDQPQQPPLLSGLVVAAAAAAASNVAQQQQAATAQLVLCLVGITQQQLDGYRVSGSSGAQLLTSMRMLEQLLLVCPAVPGTAAGLQRLQATANSCAAELTPAAVPGGQQLEEPQQEQQQSVFQQLCQLRARLMLAAFAGGATSGSSDSSSSAAASASLHIVPASQDTAAHEWRTVLLMPPDVAAAASRAATGDSSALHPRRQQFLAAFVAAQCYLQATSSVSSHSDGNSSAAGGGGFAVEIAALPGMCFQPPPLPVPKAEPAPSTMAAAAAAAAAEVEQDPSCLGPVHLALTALQVAQQVAAGASKEAAPAAEAALTAEAPSSGSLAWPLLVDLAAAATATASEPREQRQLLLLLLQGQQPWQQHLRCTLAADEQLQQRWRRELVAIANRLASEPSTGGGGAPAVVHGDERRRRTEAAVATLLPHALLCPAAVLERLVREAVVQAGEQVTLLLDVLHEMAPLAAYRQEGDRQLLLLSLLARLLAPGSQLLDTPGSKEAFLQLVAGLCGARPAVAHCKAAAPAVPASKEPLLSPAAVLEGVVAPALQSQLPAATADGLQLPLQLAERLLSAAQAPDGAAVQPPAALQPLLVGLLDLDARRIDRSPAALEASPDTFELAASILQHASSSSSRSVGSYFQQHLQAALPAGATTPQQLQQLRRRMLQLLAALLPCLTVSEAAEVLHVALPATIQAALLPPAAKQQGGGGILPGAHAAAVEAACRAAQTLVLQSGEAPIAGEQLAAVVELTAPGAAAGPPPSPLRQVAVERLLQHLTQHCARLATPVPLAAGGQAGALQQHEAQALGLRCFRELCQLAAAVGRAGYDCSTLQAGLLQLAHQLLGRQLAAWAAAEAGTTATPQQQPMLPPPQVQRQLAAAAAELPAGRMRDVVLLGIEQAAKA